MPKFYKARTSFATIIDDVPVVVKQDELVREGDPLLGSGRDKLFDPYEPESRFDNVPARAVRTPRVETADDAPVETAVAEPGTKRHRHPH